MDHSPPTPPTFQKEGTEKKGVAGCVVGTIPSLYFGFIWLVPLGVKHAVYQAGSNCYSVLSKPSSLFL